MRIAFTLPQPKVIRTDIAKTTVSPIASSPEDAWYSEANISENHFDAHEDKGRKVLKSGLGTSRSIIAANQCGLSPRDLLAKAGVGKGSEAAKRLRS